MKNAKYCEFGKAVLIKLVELNMSRKELADKTGLQHCQISCYLRGVYKPKLSTAAKIGSVIGLDIAEIADLLEKGDKPND
jgi:DNA-binding helix-turn-helix protein